MPWCSQESVVDSVLFEQVYRELFFLGVMVVDAGANVVFKILLLLQKTV